MPSEPPLSPRFDLPDELPRSAVSDSLLNPAGRAHGRPGLWHKLLLGALAVVVLIGMVIVVLAVSRLSDHRPPQNSQMLGVTNAPRPAPGGLAS